MLKDVSLSVRIGTFVEKQVAPALLSLVRAKACITLQSQLKQSILEGMYVPLCMVLCGIEFSSQLFRVHHCHHLFPFVCRYQTDASEKMMCKLKWTTGHECPSAWLQRVAYYMREGTVAPSVTLKVAPPCRVLTERNG